MTIGTCAIASCNSITDRLRRYVGLLLLFVGGGILQSSLDNAPRRH